MAGKVLVGGTAYTIKGGKTLVGGTGYGVKKGKTLVGGSGYTISFGTPVSSLAVGSSVYMNVSGTRTEFIVVNQGLPSNLYDSSCNGTWIVMKNLESQSAFGSTESYASSTIHNYLNSTFLNKLDSGIRNVISQVKIPYTSGAGGTIYSGANGLSAKAFILAANEVNSTDLSRYCPEDGARLEYFSTKSTRLAEWNGQNWPWWLRSPAVDYDDGNDVFVVNNEGGTTIQAIYQYSYCIRPAMILPSGAIFDENHNIIG